LGFENRRRGGFFDFELRRIFLNKKNGVVNFAKYPVSPTPVEECKEKKKVKTEKKCKKHEFFFE
jgi:hypothetical protein